MYYAGLTGMPLKIAIVAWFPPLFGAENSWGGLLYYAITVDCITEGKGDVRWMKCSHTKNVASLFPILSRVSVCVVIFLV